ncbi:MAG: EamA family transporter [Provencibacterium sp.]|nr:EamA family transporter [Provencibacterium sp.]
MQSNRGPLLLVFTAVLWSFAGIAVKFISWSPLTIACLRGLLAAAVIGMLNWRQFTRPTPTVWLGALALFATSTVFILCNRLTTAANAIVLQYTAPVFVILLSALFLKMRPTRLDIFTVVLTFFGIVLFFIDHLGHGALLGDCLALGTGLSFGLVFIANSMRGANPILSSFLGNLLSGLLLPFIFQDTAFRSAEPVEWLVILLMGVFQMGLSYVLFSKGMELTPPVKASVICAIEPVLNPVWVFLLMGERPGVVAILGIVVVISTILFYNIASLRRTQAPLKEPE